MSLWILLLFLLALLVLVGGVVAIVMVVARHQKQSIAFDNQIVPGMPSNAPPSWAGSHDPEARLHRRLRDAIHSLYAVNAYDTASSVNLRAGLEQSALAVDNHLIGIATLPPPHRDQALPDATAAVEAIEAGVAQYVSATTKPDPVAFEAGSQGVLTSIDAVTQHIATLGPGRSTTGIQPDQFGTQPPQPLPRQQPGAAFSPPPTGGSYPQPPAGGSHPQPPEGSGYSQPPEGGAYSRSSAGGGYPQPPIGVPQPGEYPSQAGGIYPEPAYPQQQPGTPNPQVSSPQTQQPGANPRVSSQRQPGNTNPPGTGSSDPTIVRRQP